MARESSPSDILDSLHRDGYIIIPSVLPPGSSLFTSALHATESLTNRARAGDWPYVRTLPKQFPPWNASDAKSHGIWGVQHLLHHSLPADERNVFAKVYFADNLLRIAEIILGIYDAQAAGDKAECGAQPVHVSVSDDSKVKNSQDLVMELFNLLVTPGTEDQGLDFSLCWHRDDISPETTGAAEEIALGVQHGEPKTYTHTQFNLCLADDSSLVVVPGSHLRARTAEEISLMAGDTYPYHVRLPGEVIANLKAGDVIFYDNNIVHRGMYAGDKERYTLHGSYSRKGAAAARARNVLQHGVGDWIRECDFGGLDEQHKRKAEVMRAGLVEMGRQGGWTGEYSLQG